MEKKVLGGKYGNGNMEVILVFCIGCVMTYYGYKVLKNGTFGFRDEKGYVEVEKKMSDAEELNAEVREVYKSELSYEAKEIEEVMEQKREEIKKYKEEMKQQPNLKESTDDKKVGGREMKVEDDDENYEAAW